MTNVQQMILLFKSPFHRESSSKSSYMGGDWFTSEKGLFDSNIVKMSPICATILLVNIQGAREGAVGKSDGPKEPKM